MRKSIASIVAAVAVAAFTFSSATPAVALPEGGASRAAADSWIDAPGGPGHTVEARINKRKVSILDGTTYRMICWWDVFGARYFYGEFTSGKYRGQYGDVLAQDVRNQTRVPHCD